MRESLRFLPWKAASAAGAAEAAEAAKAEAAPRPAGAAEAAEAAEAAAPRSQVDGAKRRMTLTSTATYYPAVAAILPLPEQALPR